MASAANFIFPHHVLFFIALAITSKRPADFFEHHREFQSQNRLLRIDDDIDRNRHAERRRRTASRSLRLMRLRSTAPPSGRPTVNPTRALSCGTSAILRRGKKRSCAEKSDAALPINAIEVRVLQQPSRARKTASRTWRGPLFTPARSVSAHNSQSCTIAIEMSC